MKYINLTEEQKEWIAEMQRNNRSAQFLYNARRFSPRQNELMCDPKTGEVYRIVRLGEIPRRAIPYLREYRKKWRN